MARMFAVLLCLGAVVLAGCGKRLDTGKIESEIKKGLIDQTGAKIAAVTCPNDVKPKKGNTFQCTAKAVNGKGVKIQVIQEDGNGRVSWRVANPDNAPR
jgi:hypothetical protein